MDWKMLFSRIKFFPYISLSIVALMGLGIFLVIIGQNDFISAALIYFLVTLISYIKSSGLLVIWIEKGYKKEKYIFLDNIISITMAVLFGWRFVSLLGWSIWGSVLYISLWILYFKYIYKVFIKIKLDDVHKCIGI